MTERPTLNIEFSANGNQFSHDASFDKAVFFLSCINSIAKESFKTAINDQYNKNKDLYGIEPEIRVNNLGISSVAGTIYTVVPPMLGLLAPHINSMTWSYLTNSFELIKSMTSCFFNNPERLPTIAIHEKMEGSPVIIAQDGSTVTVNNNHIVINAKKLVIPIGQLADMVKSEFVDNISIATAGSPEDHVKLLKDNSKYYDARELHIEGSTQESFFCKIYRVNVKERNGLINVFESADKRENSKSTKFIVAAVDLNNFVDALKYEYSYATGVINFKKTLFGDREIESITLHSINNVGPRQI